MYIVQAMWPLLQDLEEKNIFLEIIPSEMEVAPHPQNCWYHTEHKTI